MKNTFAAKLFVLTFAAFLIAAPLVAAPAGFASAQQDCGEGFTAQGPLCVPSNPFGGDSNSLVSQTTATGLISTIIRILLFFGGIVAVLFIIIGGYYYMTARGNEEQATKGRNTLIYALIGLALIMLSYVIITAFTNQLTKNV